MKRYKLDKKSSKKQFSRGAKPHHTNTKAAPLIYRGGIRF